MARKTTVPLYDGDDFERLAELRREVDLAEKRVDRLEREERPALSRRLGDDDLDDDKLIQARTALEAARDAYDAFVDEAAERAEMWVLEPIGHSEFRGLFKEHPPRKVKGDEGKESDDPDDAPFGVNTETFPMALLSFVDPDDDEIRTVTEPKFDTTAAFRKRVKRLSAGEFETLWVAAFLLNRQGVSDPKLSMFSPRSPRSDET